MEDSRFALVMDLFEKASNTLTGPGVFLAWLLTLFTVVIVWRRSHVSSKRFTIPLFLFQAYPLILSTASVGILSVATFVTFLEPPSDTTSEQDLEPIKPNSFLAQTAIYLWALTIGSSSQVFFGAVATRKRVTAATRSFWAVLLYLLSCLGAVFIFVALMRLRNLTVSNFWNNLNFLDAFTWFSLFLELLLLFRACRTSFEHAIHNKYQSKEDWVRSGTHLFHTCSGMMFASLCFLLALCMRKNDGLAVLWRISPLNPAIWQPDQFFTLAFGFLALIWAKSLPRLPEEAAEILPTVSKNAEVSKSDAKEKSISLDE